VALSLLLLLFWYFYWFFARLTDLGYSNCPTIRIVSSRLTGIASRRVASHLCHFAFAQDEATIIDARAHLLRLQEERDAVERAGRAAESGLPDDLHAALVRLRHLAPCLLRHPAAARAASAYRDAMRAFGGGANGGPSSGSGEVCVTGYVYKRGGGTRKTVGSTKFRKRWFALHGTLLK
jgi:hypothetical protein